MEAAGSDSLNVLSLFPPLELNAYLTYLVVISTLTALNSSNRIFGRMTKHQRDVNRILLPIVRSCLTPPFVLCEEEYSGGHFSKSPRNISDELKGR